MAPYPHPFPVGNNPPENEIAIPKGHAVGGNNDLENENAIPNDILFRGINLYKEDRNLMPNDDQFIRIFNPLKGIMEPGLFIGYRLFPSTLEHIKNVLYVGLHQSFKEFEINVVSCPCLTRPPYNLAAVGLSGNTSYLRFGGSYNLMPHPQTEITCDIRDELLRYCHDSFIIGGGYAAKPSMLYNGLLTMNATVLPPENVNNNSRIVYKDDIGHLQLKEITDPNQMVCSMWGNFFFSEGRQGMVIKIRAKGRRFLGSIMIRMQDVLRRYCQCSVVLGGVLVINGGQAECYITPENYPKDLRYPDGYLRWLRRYRYDCKNLIAVGVLGNTRFDIIVRHPNGYYLIDSRYKFHIISKDESAGMFVNDITPEETEYIGYFNIVRTAYL